MWLNALGSVTEQNSGNDFRVTNLFEVPNVSRLCVTETHGYFLLFTGQPNAAAR